MVSDSGGHDAAGTLEALASPALDPLFWPQARTAVPSAWHGHVPFAQWLVAAARPGLIVELGTHNAVSYSAFCETVLRERLPSRCYAVDSWAGDEHAGLYGEAIYTELRAFHDARYGAFSELLRMTFDEARAVIPDDAVDLLHIDGFHSYDAVQHDFQSWASKLSPRAVVLFHDTNVLEPGFGVARFWAEIRGRYPSFEFLHGHGLGVLAVGSEAPAAVLTLCGLSDPSATAILRDRFASIARTHVLEFAMREALRQQEQALQDEMAGLRQSLDASEQARAAAESRLLVQEHTVGTLEESLREAQEKARELEAGRVEDRLENRRQQAALEARIAALGDQAVEVDALRGHLAAARADAKAARGQAPSLPGDATMAATGTIALTAPGAWAWTSPLNGLRRRPSRH